MRFGLNQLNSKFSYCKQEKKMNSLVCKTPEIPIDFELIPI